MIFQILPIGLGFTQRKKLQGTYFPLDSKDSPLQLHNSVALSQHLKHYLRVGLTQYQTPNLVMRYMAAFDSTQAFGSRIKSLTSEATHSATQFFKQSYKISHPPGLYASWDALPARRKVRKLDFQSEFSMSKIIRISDFFFIEE